MEPIQTSFSNCQIFHRQLDGPKRRELEVFRRAAADAPYLLVSRSIRTDIGPERVVANPTLALLVNVGRRVLVGQLDAQGLKGLAEAMKDPNQRSTAQKVKKVVECTEYRDPRCDFTFTHSETETEILQRVSVPQVLDIGENFDSNSRDGTTDDCCMVVGGSIRVRSAGGAWRFDSSVQASLRIQLQGMQSLWLGGDSIFRPTLQFANVIRLENIGVLTLDQGVIKGHEVTIRAETVEIVRRKGAKFVSSLQAKKLTMEVDRLAIIGGEIGADELNLSTHKEFEQVGGLTKANHLGWRWDKGVCIKYDVDLRNSVLVDYYLRQKSVAQQSLGAQGEGALHGAQADPNV